MTRSAWSVLEAVAGGRHAWSRVSDLIDVGHDIFDLLDLVPDRLAFWHLRRGRAVTLTPLAAAELGVILRDEREGRRLFWDPAQPIALPKLTTRRGEVAIPIAEWPEYSPCSADPARWYLEDQAEAARVELAAEAARRRPPARLVGLRLLGVVVEPAKHRRRA